ncbi:MAG: PGPGW domain-containing protein, partial [Halioglobus sp.]
MGWEEQWQVVIVWVGVLSAIVGLLTLIAVPWVIIQLPPDYFTRSRRETWRRAPDRSYGALLLRLLKNLLGLVLVVLGVVMLVTPGQGLLTLLVGLLLMNFPGKYRLERWVVMREGVMSGMNWLRRKQGREPFLA